jgi:hypothetical protein
MINQEILLEITAWVCSKSKLLEEVNGIDCRIENDSVYVALRNGETSGFWRNFLLPKVDKNTLENKD